MKQRLIPRYHYLRADELAALKAAAERERISQSEVVRRALRAYLKL